MQRIPSNRLEIYRAKLSSKRTWGRNAEILQKAVALLEPDVRKTCDGWKKAIFEERIDTGFSDGLMRIYLLLQAYTLENLLKGELVKRMARHEKDNRLHVDKLPTVLKTHDLADMAIRIGLKLSVSETDLLRRLSRFAVWAARYPIPTKAQDFGPTWISSGDVDNAKAFIARVKSRFWKAKP